jgi:hypothetical protein
MLPAIFARRQFLQAALGLLCVLAAGLACGGGIGIPGAGTAQALLQTAQAGATDMAPTANALASQAAQFAATAATSLAEITPPALIDEAEAAPVITQYALTVLDVNVTIIKAGGLSGDIQRLLQLPQSGQSAQKSAADLALKSYGAIVNGGAASVSFGSGTLSGDLNVDLNAASLGAFTLDGGFMPATEAKSQALALEKYPGLAGRTFTSFPIGNGFAWSAQGEAPGFDADTGEAAQIPEAVLLTVTPGLPGRALVSVVVGKGDFAADVLPGP